ncbi:unnamed protein product, partial [marine sediment metagenome]
MFIQKEINFFKKIILKSPNSLAIEISGGDGNYSLSLLPYVKRMVHLDLDVKSINGACFDAKQRNHKNI